MLLQIKVFNNEMKILMKKQEDLRQDIDSDKYEQIYIVYQILQQLIPSIILRNCYIIRVLQNTVYNKKK